MKFYNSPLSSNAKRVRVMVNELGVNAETINLDFSKGENKAPEYLKKNPMGKIPTWEEDGWTLWESPAILFYLAEKYPDKKMMPAATKDRAEMMRWMFWMASHLEPAVHTALAEKVIKPQFYKQPTDEAKVAEATKEFARFAPVLNAYLEGKTWIANTFSIADIMMGAVLETCAPAGLDFSGYTHIAQWMQRLTTRDAWKKASL